MRGQTPSASKSPVNVQRPEKPETAAVVSTPPAGWFEAIWVNVPAKRRVPALFLIILCLVAGFILTLVPDWMNVFKPEEAKKEVPSQQLTTHGSNSHIIQGNPGSTFIFGPVPPPEAPAGSYDQIRKDILDALASYRNSSYATPEAARAIFRAKQTVLLHYQLREAQKNETDPKRTMDHAKAVGDSRNAILKERPIIPSVQELDKLIQFLEGSLLELAKRDQFPSHKRSLLESHLKDLAALRAGYSEVITAMLNSDSYWESKYHAIRDCPTWDYGTAFNNIAVFIENDVNLGSKAPQSPAPPPP